MNYITISQWKKKEKSNNMVVNITKITQKMNKIKQLSIEKNVIKLEKMHCCNYEKVF